MVPMRYRENLCASKREARLATRRAIVSAAGLQYDNYAKYNTADVF
jgi:hypothetical protein